MQAMGQDCNDTVDAIVESLDQDKGSRALEASKNRVPYFTRIPSLGPEDNNTIPCIKRKNEHLIEKRYCPLCFTNMTWLPMLAACTTCGLKPMILPKKQYNLPSTQAMYQVNHPVHKPAEQKQAKCRCTCADGRICPFCRVRKKCASFYKIENPPKEPSDAKQSEQFDCDQLKTVDSRPFLSRVFSELCDLCNVRDVINYREFKKQCQKSAGKPNQLKAGADAKKASEIKAKKHANVLNERKNLGYRITDAPKRRILPGHKECSKNLSFVPKHHGWNWKNSEEARKYGWQPGLIRRPIRKLMKFFLLGSPEQIAADKFRKEMEMGTKEHPPILNLRKKNGEIFITLQALNSSTMDMKPIIFKLVKSDLGVALSQIKKKLKEKGFRKCTCHKPIMLCVCRDIFEKKCLEEVLQKECRRRHMENCVDKLVLSDTSDSEIDFDFDVPPPAGSAQAYVKPKTHTHETQTAKADKKLVPKYPLFNEPYWRAYNCAAGDRYTGTAFGLPGENIFEDGVFGHAGGGPHGPTASAGGKPKSKGIWGSARGGPMLGGTRSGGARSGGGRIGADGKLATDNKSNLKAKGPKIPVHQRQRFIDDAKKRKQAEKAAAQKEIARKKRGVNLMEYLMHEGIIAEPWDPNHPNSKHKKHGPVVGPDGLTSAQRRRKLYEMMIVPPLDTMPRLGRAYDPCQCNNFCYNQCCNPYCYCSY